MSTQFSNPFPLDDPDRHAIWDMLVERDIDAFLAADFSLVEDDFIEEGFLGIDCKHTDNPDHWHLTFPTLPAYRTEWLRQAREFHKETFAEDPRPAIFAATTLRDIEINGDLALVHKKFDGAIKKSDGTRDILNWQTLYHCRRIGKQWKIMGFNGYMPNPMGAQKRTEL